jgi:NitT/TauT family transport system permease protein
LLGLVLGLVGGVALGMMLGYMRTAAAIAEPVIIGLNSLPRITVAPVLVLWFGIGLTSKVAVSLFTVFFVIFWNTVQGVRNIDVDLVRVVRVMGGGSGDVARLVVIPSVFSWIFAALRTSVSFALTGAVVGEFVGSTQGLGYRMRLAVGLLDTERVFAITVILMLFGTALVLIASRVESYLLRWRGTTHALS